MPPPFVSVLTPTYNRRAWFPMAVHCFKHQTYPQDRMEWIILDDSDPDQTVGDLVKDMKNVRYVRHETRLKLGRKRNMLLELAKGDILAHQDDDDYYPPERIAKAVRVLQGNKMVQIVASSMMYMYFISDGAVLSFGPYGPQHATAATFVFKRSLYEESPKFDDDAEKAEEKRFLRNYSFPMHQANPWDTILVMSHNRNTVDKNKLRETPERCKAQDTKVVLKGFLGKDKWALNFIKEKTAEAQKQLASIPRLAPAEETQVSQVVSEPGPTCMPNTSSTASPSATSLDSSLASS